MVKSSDQLADCCFQKMSSSLWLFTFSMVLLISLVTSAPESVTNLDQYATDPESSIGLSSSSSSSASSPESAALSGQQHKSKITVYYPNMATQDILVEDLEDVNQLLDKKGASWNRLQGAWGKRSDSWNRLNGGWGKRGPGDRDWNQLSGMWGKRAPSSSVGSSPVQSWNNLSGMWGKRAPLSPLPSSSSSSSARGSSGSWNNLSGMWGKRGWNDLNGQWGKRDSPHWNNLRGMWG